MKISPHLIQAHKMAVAGLKKSYAPYSQLHVSAVIQLKPGSTQVGGVNVENASYGATICAERSAIVSALSQLGGPLDLDFVLVISDFKGSDPIPPCGMCLQVIQEFAGPELPVYLGDEREIKKSFLLKELLPQAFNNKSLPQV
jgi:cytidine deaminase